MEKFHHERASSGTPLVLAARVAAAAAALSSDRARPGDKTVLMTLLMN